MNAQQGAGGYSRQGRGRSRMRVVREFVLAAIVMFGLSVVAWEVVGNQLSAELTLTVPLSFDLPQDAERPLLVEEQPPTEIEVVFEGPNDAIRVLEQNQNRVQVVWAIAEAAINERDDVVHLTPRAEDLSFEFVDSGPIPEAITPIAPIGLIALTVVKARTVPLTVNANHIREAFTDIPSDMTLTIEDFRVGSAGRPDVFYRGPITVDPPAAPSFMPYSLAQYETIADVRRAYTADLAFALGADAESARVFEDEACTRPIATVRVSFGFDSSELQTLTGVVLQAQVILPSRYVAAHVTVASMPGYEQTFTATVTLQGGSEEIKALSELLERNPRQFERLMYIALIVVDEGDEKLAEFAHADEVHTAAAHYELCFRRPPPGLPAVTTVSLFEVGGSRTYDDEINLRLRVWR